MTTSIDKNRLPTSTAAPTRLCLYQATRRPQLGTRTVQIEKIGSMTVTGRLGQVHANLMECLMFLAECHKVKDNRLQITVDPFKLRKAMWGGKERKKTSLRKNQPIYSAEQMLLLESDLQAAVLVTDSKTMQVRGRIVEQVRESKATHSDSRKWLLAGEGRKLQVWVFSVEWTKVMLSDVGRFYDPRPLCRIEHGSVAAIARHVLTHQYQPNGGWKLEGLMTAAGVERQASKVMKEMAEDIEELRELGIVISAGRGFLAAPATQLAAPATQTPIFSRTRHAK